jgi:dolichol-phosphate mannosyltransferase
LSKLAVIVPCLNEEDNVVTTLEWLSSALEKLPFSSEIIVIDDLSNDKTYEYASSYKNETNVTIKVFKKELHRRGYGAVIKFGLAHTTSDYVTFVSADRVDPIHILEKMAEKLDKGLDLVQCSRYLEKENQDTIPFKYKFFQFFFRRFATIALGAKIADSTYAFKMFKREKIMALGVSSNRFNISPEIMFKAVLAGYRYGFISAGQGTRELGESKFNFKKEGFGFGMCLIRGLLHRLNLVYWF